jgi:type IV pilus assembly protein PilY1
MKKIQALFLALSFMLMGYSASLHAEDIDIYTANTANIGVPNVVFVLDNGADFDASSSSGCSTYSDGTGVPPSTGTGKTSGVIQCSLVNAISSLPSSGAVNIGIVTSNGNNFANTQATTDKTKGGYHELCNSTSNGGCVLRNLTLMDTSGKSSLIAFIKGWALTSQSDANSFVIKVNSSAQASEMQETWAYFNGKTGLSGKSYSPSILGTGCQKNFVVYISNTQKKPSTSEYGSASGALTTAGATTAQKTEIAGSIKFTPAVCSTTTTYTLAAGNNLADEWARLMYQQDGGAAGNQNIQNIITYTIGVQSSGSQCSEDTYGLIASMAKVGGGKFFNTSSVGDLTTALQTVLNEVQAVNSVFSSASLPVSVNAEGSYLNQIFLGMFRPDSNGNPRWLGNLKQYQLIANASGSLVLGDNSSPPQAAISSSGTGFISPTAQSFWTYKDTANAPDDATTGGFFVNNQVGTPPSAFDLPDGEVVEKGGAAQQMRKENLKNDWSTTAGASTNPRRLYTYCPSGASCVADLTASANAFTTSNSGISSSAFGASTSLPISSITRNAATITVTTQSPHGLSVGSAITIQGSSESAYNGNFTVVTVPTSSTFTVGGFTDTPTTPSAGTYTVAPLVGGSVNITSIVRTTTTTGSKTQEPATVTTSAAHGFSSGDSVTINGTLTYNNNYTVGTVVDATHFTISPTISPQPSSTGWSAQLSSTAYPQISGASFSNGVTGTLKVQKTGIVVWQGQSVTLKSTSGSSNSKYNGTYTISSVDPATNSFSITGLGNSFKSNGPETGTVSYDYTPVTVSLSRVATTDTVTVTATGATANKFGFAATDTRTLVLSKSAATSTETAYAYSGTVACAAAGCTSFTYSASTSPSSTATAASGQTMTVAKGSTSGTANLAAGAITHTGTTATITGLPSGTFTNGQTVTISQTGTAQANETAYAGTWTLTCTALCTTATFGPVTVSPALSVTNSGMTLFAGATPPDKSTVIRWIRGEDSFGDEAGPGHGVTVRPSIHGDVLHSRPLVLNYGDTRGIVVFYGANDGVFRAVNGNQSTAMGTVAAGDELWGLILPEHYGLFNRQRTNSPAVKFPGTLLTSAQTKDYFVDGPTGVYQKLKADTSIDKAYIYLTMRRGGSFLYGLDVSTPTSPSVLWRIDGTTTGFSELGQTWSRPKLTLLQSSTYQTTPVIIFGGGYDDSEDNEPPTADGSGRGIYIVNAVTGALIWSATPTCTTSATCLNVPGMTYSIPSDITFVDRDGDGFTDKLYFTDVGGNIWRADITAANSASWTVTQIAALGCDTGTCASGTTPRKFFFPPSVLSVLPGGTTGSYDLISIGSGDREHPLKSTASGSAYNVVNRFYTIVDTGTALGTPVTTNINQSTLFDATSTQWDGTGDGFYITLGTGEKEVNAPTAVNGYIFFATNKPANQDATCIANLGIATAYAVSPFLGTVTSNQLAGGGLPPSAVSGVILITTTDPVTNQTTTSQEKFCIGCGVSGLESGGSGGSGGNIGGDCAAALGQCTPVSTVPKNMKRTYWYRK